MSHHIICKAPLYLFVLSQSIRGPFVRNRWQYYTISREIG